MKIPLDIEHGMPTIPMAETLPLNRPTIYLSIWRSCVGEPLVGFPADSERHALKCFLADWC